MIIAIPLEDGQLSAHFGHSSVFSLIETDAANAVANRRDLEAPPHEPGSLPTWLAENGVDLVICGSIGPRAVDLLAEKGVKVVAGAAVDAPESLIAAHFAGTLAMAESDCHHH